MVFVGRHSDHTGERRWHTADTSILDFIHRVLLAEVPTRLLQVIVMLVAGGLLAVAFVELIGIRQRDDAGQRFAGRLEEQSLAVNPVEAAVQARIRAALEAGTYARFAADFLAGPEGAGTGTGSPADPRV